MPKISVIVPVYNVEKYLENCLDSLRCQTFSDIEIICIDDCSTDNSLKIIMEMAKEDERIKTIFHESNFGTLMARKHGVEMSTGTYLMFLDSDDWLESDACGSLYDKMEKEQVDILHYGTNVIPAIPLSVEMIKWIEDFLKPYNYKVKDKNILGACFIEDKYDFNITNKMWKTELCKRAFAEISDVRMIAAEDRYAFFLLGYYAKTYMGFLDKNYYNYNVGIGITGSDNLDLERFEKRCTGVLAVKAVKRFLDSQEKMDLYHDIYVKFEHKILWDCVDCWYNKLNKDDYGLGYDILLRYWEPQKVVAAIARVYFEKEEDILSRVKDSTLIKNKKQVGIFCRYLEPMMKYIEAHIDLIRQSGGEAILFTDMDDQHGRDIGCGVNVVLLPTSTDANWERYEVRAKQLYREVEKRKIDILLYASPSSHVAWLDILMMQSSGLCVLYMDEMGILDLYGMLGNKSIQEFILDYEKLQNQYYELLESGTFKFKSKVRLLIRKLKVFLDKLN